MQRSLKEHNFLLTFCSSRLYGCLSTFLHLKKRLSIYDTLHCKVLLDVTVVLK